MLLFRTGEHLQFKPNPTDGHSSVVDQPRSCADAPSGDRGFLDSDGWLHHVGRSKECVNRGGETIPVVEIEEVLCAHPRVLEAMVFAAPHVDLGEVTLRTSPIGPEPTLGNRAQTPASPSPPQVVAVAIPDSPGHTGGKTYPIKMLSTGPFCRTQPTTFTPSSGQLLQSGGHLTAM